jgi:hypothetical protein
VVEDLATLGFLDRHENVVPVGSPGVGKTHIAVALGVEAVRAREPTYFTDCQRLVSDLAHAAGKGQLERRLRFYAHLSLLIVDEVGYLDVDKQGAGLLFRLVSRGHEGRSTIVTTDVGMGSWAKVFGDPVVASAIADRLCHHCHLIRITGRSLQDQGPRAAGQGLAGSGRRSRRPAVTGLANVRWCGWGRFAVQSGEIYLDFNRGHHPPRFRMGVALEVIGGVPIVLSSSRMPFLSSEHVERGALTQAPLGASATVPILSATA